MSSHWACHRSGTRVIAMPPLAFSENRPILKRPEPVRLARTERGIMSILRPRPLDPADTSRRIAEPDLVFRHIARHGGRDPGERVAPHDSRIHQHGTRTEMRRLLEHAAAAHRRVWADIGMIADDAMMAEHGAGAHAGEAADPRRRLYRRA